MGLGTRVVQVIPGPVPEAAAVAAEAVPFLILPVHLSRLVREALHLPAVLVVLRVIDPVLVTQMVIRVVREVVAVPEVAVIRGLLVTQAQRQVPYLEIFPAEVAEVAVAVALAAEVAEAAEAVALAVVQTAVVVLVALPALRGGRGRVVRVLAVHREPSVRYRVALVLAAAAAVEVGEGQDPLPVLAAEAAVVVPEVVVVAEVRAKLLTIRHSTLCL